MAVDRVVERDGREAPCRTHEIPLGEPVDPGDLPAVEGVDEESRRLLAARYGHAAHEVVAIAEGDASLARRITADRPDLLAESVFAARREQAASVSDLFLRRTRLGLLDAPRLVAPSAPGAEAMARAMAPELGWDDAEVAAQIETWHRIAGAEGLVPGAREPV